MYVPMILYHYVQFDPDFKFKDFTSFILNLIHIYSIKSSLIDKSITCKIVNYLFYNHIKNLNCLFTLELIQVWSFFSFSVPEQSARKHNHISISLPSGAPCKFRH